MQISRQTHSQSRTYDSDWQLVSTHELSQLRPTTQLVSFAKTHGTYIDANFSSHYRAIITRLTQLRLVPMICKDQERACVTTSRVSAFRIIINQAYSNTTGSWVKPPLTLAFKTLMVSDVQTISSTWTQKIKYMTPTCCFAAGRLQCCAITSSVCDAAIVDLIPFYDQPVLEARACS
jgi:hypothetical protein